MASHQTDVATPGGLHPPACDGKDAPEADKDRHDTESEYSDPTFYSDDDSLFDSVGSGPDTHSKLSNTILTAIEESNQFTIPRVSFAIQKETTVSCRRAMVDWMIRVTTRVKWHKLTLYNAVYVLDKILSRIEVKRSDIYLLSATCLWISTKLEETSGPSLPFFLRICQNKFKAEDFTMKECEICPLVNGRFNYPRPVFFLRPFLEEINASEEVERMAQFCLDASLLSFEFIEVPAPVVTVVAIAASMGDQCPIRRLCAAAQCDADLPYFSAVMTWMHQSAVIARDGTTALSELYKAEEIQQFTAKLESSVVHYSQKRGL